MNLNEERNYQRLLDTLDAMGLEDENRKLAEEYFDIMKGENKELLFKVKHQDFSVLDDKKREICAKYAEHCRKRNRIEELGRFVKFAAAVGGSTSYYVLISYGWNLDHIQDFLTPEQIEAVRAEGIVWNEYYVKRAGDYIKASPQILREAMKLCYNESDNAKVLLAGLSLYYTRTKKSNKLKGKIFKEEPDKNERETVSFLENSLIESIDNLFTGAKPSEVELDNMKSFVRNGKPDEKLPEEIYNALRGKAVSEYLITLLAGVSFMAIEYSKTFVRFIHLSAAINHTVTLNACLEMGGRPWFNKNISMLEDNFPVRREDFMLWCLEHKILEPLKRAAESEPNVIKSMVSVVSTEQYQELSACVRESNTDLYREINASGAKEFHLKLAKELADDYKQGSEEVRLYLLGEADLDVLYPFVDGWRKEWYYSTSRYEKINKLLDNANEQQMYRRGLVMEGLCLKSGFFTYYWKPCKNKKINRDAIIEILNIYQEEKLPISYQLELLGGIHDGIYQDKEKVKFINECVYAISQRKTEYGEELVRLSKEGTATVRYICISFLSEFWQDYKEELLSCAVDSSKQVREILAAVYAIHKECEPEIKAMLSSKKSQEREMAVLVIKKWGVDLWRTDLEAALEKEKSKKIKELIQVYLGMENTEEAAVTMTCDDLVKELLKGGKKRKVSWVTETTLSQVHMTDGTPASEDYMAAILVAYADMGIPGVNKDSARLAEQLNSAELSSYMVMLFNKWLEEGGEAKKKWVLYAASIHGGDEIIPVIFNQIQEWPKAARGAIAAEAVRALALNGSSTALLLVDQISRKFKFRQVKKAAGDALNYAAEQLGITRAELEDRIVPNLGFDETMEQSFDYGTRSFRVVLTTALELEIYDETDKKLKSMPSPGKKDDLVKAKAASDAFKLLKKQLKTVAGNQKLRLEQALCTERLWTVGQWKELFVKNPVMHQFAAGLIWGLYEEGNLKETFRYMEDGSFNTVDEEEYEFPAEGMIGLVHPIELSEEDLSAWREQLSDYEVIQPVEQLERPVYRIAKDEENQKEMTRFGGMLLNGLSLSGKLQGMGWNRGDVEDAGVYYTFCREDGDVSVELEFSGSFVGDENEEVTVYGVIFRRRGAASDNGGDYRKNRENSQYKLSEISPRYLSEIILQLTRATASSQERLSYPECRR